MKNLFTKLSAIVRHNPALMLGIGLSVCLVVWGTGCNSTVTSIKSPERKITRVELNDEIASEERRIAVELENLHALAMTKNQQLDEQDALRASILEFGLLAAQGGAVNPLALIPMAGMLLGVGSAIDNRRKDAIIAGTKMGKE